MGFSVGGEACKERVNPKSKEAEKASKGENIFYLS